MNWRRLAAGLVLAVALTPGSQARELAADPDRFSEAELVTVGVAPGTGVPVALLRTLDSRELVPIFIGPFEARAILMALQGIETPRPMTHDLIGNLLDATGAQVSRLLIDELSGGTFFGMLEISVEGESEPRLVDTRPSDGLAVAIRAGARIMVAPRVVAEAGGQPWEGIPGEQVVRVLGITVVEATAELRAALGLPDQGGVLVSQVEGRSAAAGIKAGSLLLAVNDEPVDDPLDLLELSGDSADGEPLRLRLWQDGAERAIEITPTAPAGSERELRI
ncbi:MAG: bifunctional nuclease family protein [Chromatiales bacterium]|nr:bifunctional nuclease family protein [Chromatiales bacterium]